jgi:hypothetical protein
MSDDLVDGAEGYEEEGIEAFNRMADAMQGLQSRLGALDQGLGSRVSRAEQAATKAETAAANARQAAEHLEATSPPESPFSRLLGHPGGRGGPSGSGRGRILARARQRSGERLGGGLQGRPGPERRRILGQHPKRAARLRHGPGRRPQPGRPLRRTGLEAGYAGQAKGLLPQPPPGQDGLRLESAVSSLALLLG